MTVKLPDGITTPQQVEACLMDLEAYIGSVRDRSVRQTATQTNEAPPQLSAELVIVLAAAGLGENPNVQQLEELKALVGTWRELPIIEVTLPAIPGPTLRKQLVSWFRALGQPVLVQFSFQRELAGGLMVRTPKRVYDFSFRRQIMAGREKLGEAMRRV